jgi:hypothetical protein
LPPEFSLDFGGLSIHPTFIRLAGEPIRRGPIEG